MVFPCREYITELDHVILFFYSKDLYIQHKDSFSPFRLLCSLIPLDPLTDIRILKEQYNISLYIYGTFIDIQVGGLEIGSI